MDDTPPIPGFRYLVTNPERLGGKPTIQGTRLSASFILACPAVSGPPQQAFQTPSPKTDDAPKEPAPPRRYLAISIEPRWG